MIERYNALCTAIKEQALAVGRKPTDVQLVVVTKNHPWEQIAALYDAGQRLFGESRPQEFFEKFAAAPSDVQWHFIGHLQKNKVRKMAGLCHLIHSVDTFELAHKISVCNRELGIEKCPILLQVNTSQEQSKQGVSMREGMALYEKLLALPTIDVQGLMTMAPHSDDERGVRSCFARLREFRETLSKAYASPLPHLSMGMSNDYLWAIAEGATIVRVGTFIFKGGSDG